MNKIKKWWTKPRKGFWYDYTNWLLNSPKALGYLMFTGTLIALILFGSSFIYALFTGNMLMIIILGIVTFVLSKRMYNIGMMSYKLGSPAKLYNMSANEFVFGGDDFGESYDEDINKTDEEGNGEEHGEVRGVHRSIKRTYPGFSDYIQESSSTPQTTNRNNK